MIKSLNTSTLLKFEKLNNTRDLGGIKTCDGATVAYNRLLRSGNLFSASKSDVEWVNSNVSLVVDLRTAEEREGKPDPLTVNAEYVHIPVLERMSAGVSREAESDAEAFRIAVQNPHFAKRYMLSVYKGFVTEKFTMGQYAAFVKLLAKKRGGAALWHCSAGKDRAGFATIIILEILGVKRSDIIADYLATNTYIKEEIDGVYADVEKSFGKMNKETAGALEYLFVAKEEYLNALYSEVDDIYGSFDKFIANGLKVSASEIQVIKELYLCK